MHRDISETAFSKLFSSQLKRLIDCQIPSNILMKILLVSLARNSLNPHTWPNLCCVTSHRSLKSRPTLKGCESRGRSGRRHPARPLTKLKLARELVAAQAAAQRLADRAPARGETDRSPADADSQVARAGPPKSPAGKFTSMSARPSRIPRAARRPADSRTDGYSGSAGWPRPGAPSANRGNRRGISFGACARAQLMLARLCWRR